MLAIVKCFMFNAYRNGVAGFVAQPMLELL